jgi:aspartyl-tRNA(Asn)/glutamyl-tRNA(Gln) amidotransferase subunit C
MAAPELDVQAVARLARVALSEEEVATFGAQLGRVLEHIELLGRVDISGVEPTAHANPVFNVLRDDEPIDGLQRAEVLALAPRQANSLVIVPKVIE